jgi:hypothetical protein
MEEEPAADALPDVAKEEVVPEDSGAAADVGEAAAGEEEDAEEAAAESESPRDGLTAIPIKKRPEEPPQEEIIAGPLLSDVPPEDFDRVTLVACVEELQKLKRDEVSRKNYLKANFYSQLIKQSQKAAEVTNFSFKCCGQLTYFPEKQADVQDKVDEADRMWQQLFQEKVDFKMQRLTNTQNEELDKFNRERPTATASTWWTSSRCASVSVF